MFAVYWVIIESSEGFTLVAPIVSGRVRMETIITRHFTGFSGPCNANVLVAAIMATIARKSPLLNML
eukprot:CFRG5769T1